MIGRCTARFVSAVTTSAPTPESAPVGGETVYGLTKVDQEKLILLWGKQTGIPTVALRYSCTYGPRQSIFNPYTGVIAIFCTRLLNNLPPVLYEDGEQTRDFSFVEDIARANLLAAETDKLDGLPVNVGSGKESAFAKWPNTFPTRSISTSRQKQKANSVPAKCAISPAARIAFGRQVMSRRLTSRPGIERYLDWIRQQADVRDYFSEAAGVLRRKGIVHRVETADE